MMILMSVGYSWMVLAPFVSQGVSPAPAIEMFAGAVSMFIFMATLRQARSLYIGDDYDMLSALPIRKRDIVTVKIFMMYLTVFVLSFLVMVPHGVMLGVYAHNVPMMLVAFLLAFTLPIAPVAVAALIALLVTIATARFKSANLVFVIVYSILIIALIAASMVMGRLSEAQAAEGYTAMGGIMRWFNPTFILAEKALTESYLYLIPYVCANIVIIVGTVLLLALLFDYLHSIVVSVSMKKSYVRKELKTATPARQLIRLEFQRLINSRVYFMNMILGAVMSILGTAAFMFSFSQSMATASEEALPLMRTLFIPMHIAIVSLILGITSPTTGCINIEGKTFWIIKSLPTDYKAYMRSKLLFALSMYVPAAIIASTVALIFYQGSAWDIVAMYLIPVAYVVLNALVGLIVALHFPKLKWNNETEAVKNSMSVLVALLINFGVTLVLGAIVIVIPALLPAYAFIGYLVVFAAIMIAIIPCAVYLNNNFAKKIAAMEEA
ncbi:MAG: hypothetical protein K6E59_02445 [Bacilli bacterium]|nr:hypothetical protein [Bacilli bacterium]